MCGGGKAPARAGQAAGSWKGTGKIIFEGGKKKSLWATAEMATPEVKITGIFFHPTNTCGVHQEGG